MKQLHCEESSPGDLVNGTDAPLKPANGAMQGGALVLRDGAGEPA